MLELGSLVRRDHDELHYALRVMGELDSDEDNVRDALERVRVLFPAHVEAEAVALGAMLGETLPPPPPALYFMISQVTASHLAQETALTELMKQRVGTPAFIERARYARQLIVHHADHEAACLHPALPDHVPREVFWRMAHHYSHERAHLLVVFAHQALARSA
jgi:hypothetical protein